jgi:hypothetical protein
LTGVSRLQQSPREIYGNLPIESGTYPLAKEREKEFFCVISNVSMQLMMFIGNDLIEAVPLEHEYLRRPGYLGNFKRNLKVKYRELIKQFPDPPEFLVIDPQPKTPAHAAKK